MEETKILGISEKEYTWCVLVRCFWSHWKGWGNYKGNKTQYAKQITVNTTKQIGKSIHWG